MMRQSFPVLLLLCGSLAAAVATPASAAQTTATRYTRLTIIEPASDATLRDNGGNVTIRVESRPRLKTAARHRVRVLLDGKPQALEFEKSVATLKNVDRGSHELVAVIVDRNDAELVRSQPVTFYLHRRSLLHRNQKSANGDKKSPQP